MKFKRNRLPVIMPLFFSSVLVLLIISCNGKYPSNVENALKKAGNNRLELEKLITHYSTKPSDSLKLKAAYFLISNMPGHHYYVGQQLDNYQGIFDSLSVKQNMGHTQAVLGSFNERYGVFDTYNLTTEYDIEVIKTDYLIRNIEQAFKVWQEQPWGKDIDFNTFCEYILPYRLADEPIEEWRTELYDKYNSYLDSVRLTNGNAIDACTAICKVIRDTFDSGSQILSFLPSQGSLNLIKYKMGSCRDDAQFAAYIMRSLGIPVSIEFTPQWPFRSMGHTWNAVFDASGNAIKFTGTVAMPGESLLNKDDYKYGKIYRKTYSINNQSLKSIKEVEESIPGLFEADNFIDVTNQFVKTATIQVELQQPVQKKLKYVYLSVFNNQSWVPNAWAMINGSSATFENVEVNIAYLPVYYSSDGLFVAGQPFIVANNGNLLYLVANKQKPISLVLSRKYPYFKRIDDFIRRMNGGVFQVSNRPDFKNPIEIWKIDSVPDPIFYEFSVKTATAYRYFRYLSPNEGWGNIAEMEVYGSNNMILKGNIIGTNGTWEGTDRTKEKAFDKDIVSFFDAPIPDGAWVGLDFGKPVTIEKIRYMPRNDGNIIEKGDTYELVYWDNGWQTAGKQVAQADSVVFDKMPSGALYLLHNLTKGLEERVFTYEAGKQVWW